jgi:UDP-N-acetylmuramate dehydrogenase
VPLNLESNYDLTVLNSFGVAARAAHYLRVTDDASFPEAIQLARAHAGERGVFVLGGGSNLLLTKDYAGCVLHIATQGMRVLDEDVVEAMAGESWHAFVMWTINQGYCGLENLTLIHGSVGAAPIQNIGAYGVELKESFHSCDAISIETGETRRFSAQECAFSYRNSYFKSFAGRQWIVRRVRFKLSRSPKFKLDYGDLRNALISKGIVAPSALDVSQAVAEIRMRKLPDPVLLGNAGSFFKNPVIPAAQFLTLRDQNPAMPHYPDDDGWMKIPAAWLIEHAGFKGLRHGDAAVHAQHALVLVNHGNATGDALWALAQEVQAGVETKFGVKLEPEPIIL